MDFRRVFVKLFTQKTGTFPTQILHVVGSLVVFLSHKKKKEPTPRAKAVLPKRIVTHKTLAVII